MKIALLLTGLQRNFEPFIKNQLELLIKNNNCDLFIFTSNKMCNRTKVGGNISYIENTKNDNDISFFEHNYTGFLRNVKIDNDDKLFNEYFTKFSNMKKFHMNLLQAYFKVTRGLELIENHEKENSIKYDVIVRGRLDGFLLNDLSIEALNINKNEIYMSESNDHKDDSIIIFNRKNLKVVKDFLSYLETKVYQLNNIFVEGLLIEWLKQNQLKIIFKSNLLCRLGCPDKLSFRTVPFFRKEDISKLTSYEYDIQF